MTLSIRLLCCRVPCVGARDRTLAHSILIFVGPCRCHVSISTISAYLTLHSEKSSRPRALSRLCLSLLSLCFTHAHPYSALDSARSRVGLSRSPGRSAGSVPEAGARSRSRRRRRRLAEPEPEPDVASVRAVRSAETRAEAARPRRRTRGMPSFYLYLKKLY